MKKLLYVTANSKPENLSASKTVGREFIKRFLQKNEDFELEELDLYKANIPKLQYEYFQNRSCLIDEESINKLDNKKKLEASRIIELCEQFKNADVCVIAVPMWSLSFPAPLKEYIDCIVIDGRTVKISKGEKPEGLLKDKERSVIYIQSSGAKLNVVTKLFMDKGLNYIETIMKFMGIAYFEELLVDGTGFTEEEKSEAIERAKGKIDRLIANVKDINTK